MSKSSPEIDRLLNEFKAQDLAVDMVVMVGFKRLVVAKYVDGNQSWELTQDGRDLLDPPPAEEDVPGPKAAPKGMQPRNIDVRMPAVSRK